jgi:type IV secretory pathway TrbD component
MLTFNLAKARARDATVTLRGILRNRIVLGLAGAALGVIAMQINLWAGLFMVGVGTWEVAHALVVRTHPYLIQPPNKRLKLPARVD